MLDKLGLSSLMRCRAPAEHEGQGEMERGSRALRTWSSDKACTCDILSGCVGGTGRRLRDKEAVVGPQIWELYAREAVDESGMRGDAIPIGASVSSVVGCAVWVSEVRGCRSCLLYLTWRPSTTTKAGGSYLYGWAAWLGLSGDQIAPTRARLMTGHPEWRAGRQSQSAVAGTVSSQEGGTYSSKQVSQCYHSTQSSTVSHSPSARVHPLMVLNSRHILPY